MYVPISKYAHNSLVHLKTRAYGTCICTSTLRLLLLNFSDFHDSLIWRVLILADLAIISSSDTYRIAGNFIWCKFSYISYMYVSAVCENKNYENLKIQNFRNIKTMHYTRQIRPYNLILCCSGRNCLQMRSVGWFKNKNGSHMTSMSCRSSPN